MLPGVVSVVIPAFNQRAYLAAAIASVRAQPVPTELIVVDDGSTDGTGALADREPAIVCIHQRRQGVQAARNAGLSAAHGEFVVFLDADDVLLDGALETGLDLLNASPDAVLAAGRCRVVDAVGQPLPTTHAPAIERDHYRALLSSNCIWTPGCVIFRRAAVADAGGFSSRFAPSADYALYLRLARTGRLLCHAREVLLYRRHADSMSRDPVRMLRSTLGALDEERAHVPPGLRADFERGRCAWRDYYADMIVEEIRAAWRARRWPPFLRNVVALAWLHPMAVIAHAERKGGRTLRGHLAASGADDRALTARPARDR